MNSRPISRACEAAIFALVFSLAAASAAAPTRPLRLVFVRGKPLAPPSPYARTIERVFRHEAVVVSAGTFADVTRWRPAGKGVETVITLRAGAERLDIHYVVGSTGELGTKFAGDRTYPSKTPAGLVAQARGAARELLRALEQKDKRRAPSAVRPVPRAALAAFERALAVTGKGAGALIDRRAHLARAAKLAPGWALARLELGRTINAQGDGKGATTPLLKACKLAPRDPEAFAELGLAYRHMGRTADAISSYSRALELAPLDPVVHNNFGVALLDVREMPGALRHFKRAAQIEPLYHEPHVNLGTWCRAKGREKEAETHYHRAVKLAPEAAGPRIALANLLTDGGRLREAERQLEAAVGANPEHTAARFELALALARREKFTPAIENLERVVKAAPEYREAWYNLGICYHHAADHDKAVELFEARIRREPGYPHYYYGLGLAYEGKGEKKLAEAALKMALEKAPRFQPARLALRRIRGEGPAPQLAWPWGMWCGSARGESAASCVPAAITLAALFLPALVMRRRNSARRAHPR